MFKQISEWHVSESGDYFAQSCLPSACLPSGIARQTHKKEANLACTSLLKFVNKQDFRGLSSGQTLGKHLGKHLGKQKNRKRAKRVVRRTRVRSLLKQGSTETNLWSNLAGKHWENTGQTLALAHTWPGRVGPRPLRGESG